jgi:hypothetical protein
MQRRRFCQRPLEIPVWYETLEAQIGCSESRHHAPTRVTEPSDLQQRAKHSRDRLARRTEDRIPAISRHVRCEIQRRDRNRLEVDQPEMHRRKTVRLSGCSSASTEATERARPAWTLAERAWAYRLRVASWNSMTGGCGSRANSGWARQRWCDYHSPRSATPSRECVAV